MAGNSTVLSAGKVTVSTTGYQTGAILNRLNALIATSQGSTSISSYDASAAGTGQGCSTLSFCRY